MERASQYHITTYGGKGHPKKVSFSGEKGGTLTIETQIQTVKLWQLITGGEVSKTAKFMVREELAVTGSGATVTLSEEKTLFLLLNYLR